MDDLNLKDGIWFIYDGECPICRYAAAALKIQKKYGQLHLLNARDSANNTPLIQEINKRNLDLDEGMIIYLKGKFYHGKDALNFMAQYGDTQNIFMLFCRTFFRSNTISKLTYPWMRGVRNFLLRRLKIKQIDNLNLHNKRKG